MPFKRLRYDWTTIEPGERVYNKIKEVRVYEDWTSTFTGGHCDLIFNSTARVGWATGRPTPPEYSHGEWSTPGVCDEYTGRWEATANTNYGSYSMVKEFEVVEDCYVFARYDFTGSGSASYRHISVTINGSYAAEPGVDGTRKFSKGDRIRFTFVKTANPSAAAGDVAFVSMELPSYVEADVTPIGWTYYTLHWVGESGIGTKGEDVTVEHTAHLKDDITNKRMVTDLEAPEPLVSHVFFTHDSEERRSISLDYDKPIDLDYVSFKYDINPTELNYTGFTALSSNEYHEYGVVTFGNFDWYDFNVPMNSSGLLRTNTTSYSGVSCEYEKIIETEDYVGSGSYRFTELGMPVGSYTSMKFVFDRTKNECYVFKNETLYGKLKYSGDAVNLIKNLVIYTYNTTVYVKNIKVTGYNKLDAALGD